MSITDSSLRFTYENRHVQAFTYGFSIPTNKRRLFTLHNYNLSDKRSQDFSIGGFGGKAPPAAGDKGAELPALSNFCILH